jgi:serine/threonine protein kinase
MISAPRVCPECGARIFADAPRGFCSVCLFKTGLGGFVEENGETPPVRIPMPFGDYELQGEIGRGGQGVVYRARQKSLNRTVALKIIVLGHWATARHLKRFRLEAEAAARLNHPSIVPIHEIGERDGCCYFSMNLIEGGQLDEVVRREAISIRRVAELIAKLARTVHYAHEHGVLHRDIKPGNILLDKEGEPHLTDFGLARLVETESTVTRTTEVLGTPSYMAPEQASGNNVALTSATDIYGLGAVLYHLLTGCPPFAGGTTYETVRLVLETEPRQPRLLNPKVNRDLSTICLKCLQKDPQRRYASALALAEDIERWLKHEPIQARRTGLFTRGKKWLQRNPTGAISVVSLVGLVAAVGVIIWKSDLVRPSGDNGIALLPFENLAEDKGNAYFADGIQDEILTRLSKIRLLKVIARTSTDKYKSRPQDLRQIGKQLGVSNLLEGSVQKAGNVVHINVQLIHAATGNHIWAESYDRKLDDIFAVEGDVAGKIAIALNAKLTGAEQQVLTERPTNNSAAYDAYLRGLAIEPRGWYSAEAKEAFRRLYAEATRLDPKFVAAWARLARTDAWMVFLGDDVTQERREAARHALDMAIQLQPDSTDTLFAKAYCQYWLLRDYSAAKALFLQLRARLPNSSEVLTALSAVTRRQGAWDESLEYSHEALTLNPRDPRLLVDRAWTYAIVRRFDDALKTSDRMMEIVPNDPDAVAYRAAIFHALGKMDEARHLFGAVQPDVTNDSLTGILIQHWLLERDYQTLIETLQPALTDLGLSAMRRAIYREAVGFAQLRAGDVTAARKTLFQARRDLEIMREQDAYNSEIAAHLGNVCVYLGDRQLGLSLAEHALLLLPTSQDLVLGPALEENLAHIETEVGEKDRAIARLQKLLQTPYSSVGHSAPITPQLLRLHPFWDPLRDDPRFEKIVASLAPK